MTSIKKIALAFMLASSCLPAQNSAFVTFSKNYIPADKFPAYSKIEIDANGIALKIKDKTYRITLQETDRLEFRNSGFQNNLNYTVYTKLQPKTHYIIKPDICSLYQIIPANAKTDSTEGTLAMHAAGFLRIIVKNRTPDSLFVSSAFYFPSISEINKKDTSAYFSVQASGFCPYATSQVSLCKVKGNVSSRDPFDEALFKDKNLYSTVSIQFFGNEKYTLVYDVQNNSCTVTFDGYIDSKKEIEEPGADGIFRLQTRK